MLILTADGTLTSGSLGANVNISGGAGGAFSQPGQPGVAALGRLPQQPTAIPEPGTWVLILVGLAAVAVAAWRQRLKG